ncbi:hypothetical protein [Paenibacillus graminis]|uniref:Uncharacterized protein n=1 Tax=Paenibacillus graminis TaxID=189425 RepID=A0A089MDE0_9BACL|nr:hypothetical protein [Paenibacillus graminis]AIQ70375.1 hypothetical protein PGRAT_24140 [Paenibacillus graminis]MEC0169739.1 hypothetical protein [Paenibacillus graminis]
MSLQIKYLNMPRNRPQPVQTIPNRALTEEKVSFDKPVKNCWACISYINLYNTLNPKIGINNFDLGVEAVKDETDPNTVIVKSVYIVQPTENTDVHMYTGYFNMLVFADLED